MKRLLRTAVAPLLLLPVACTMPASDDTVMERVERPGFSAELPAWPLHGDEDAVAMGRYAVRQGQRLAEVAWTPSASAGPSDLDVVADALIAGFGFETIERRHESLEDQIRLHLLLRVEAGGWAAFVLIQCERAGVQVTLALTDPERTAATARRDRVLDSFVCPTDPSLFETRWPTTDLPDDFGLLVGTGLVLGHRDGLWLMVAPVAASLIENMSGSPDQAQRALSAFGHIFAADFTVLGGARRVRASSGIAHAWNLDSPPYGPTVAVGFTCARERTAYVVFAADESRANDYAALESLAVRFGCPDGVARAGYQGGALRPMTERPGVCEVGADELCKALTADEP